MSGEDVVGITAIKLISNDTSSAVTVRNSENPRKRKNGGTVPALGSLDVDMWIPWSREPEELTKHCITVNLGRGKSFTIHQSDDVDGDFVRILSGRDEFPGARIGGHSLVDGNRHMRISSTGRITLSEL
jgi:hypothetical protein